MAGNNQTYIYNVEILVEDESNQQALMQLLQKLSSLNVIDYKITSGIQLGSEIEKRKQAAPVQNQVPVVAIQTKAKSVKKEAVKEKSKSKNEEGIKLLTTFKEQNKLVRFIVNRGLGVKLSIPCRVLNIDETELVSVYHVDEKQVYTFRLNEIEDYSVV